MSTKGWVVALFIVGGMGVGIRGCDVSSTDPDQKLAKHLEDLCGIARTNVETPERGVKHLGRYFAKNLGNITGAFGDTIAVIERVSDDTKHDARARLARDRIHGPLIACEGDWIRFGEAVEANPKATAMIERAGIRLNRTFDILLGKRGFTLRELPVQLRSALTF